MDLIITSPPYYTHRMYNGGGNGIGQESTPEEYLSALLETLQECCRVVKPTGSIVYNLGDKYTGGNLMLLPYQFAIKASTELPLQLINEITWVKTNPTPRQYKRRLVSGTEPFFHFALGPSYYYDREAFFHNDKSTITNRPTAKLGQSYRKLIDDSSELTALQKELAHSELDIVINEVHNGKIKGFRMKIKGIHAEAFGGQSGGRKSQMDRNGFTIIRLLGAKMKKDVIESPVENVPGTKHTAIFPQQIIREFIKMLCPAGGLVVDPYMGSGTTALAAISEGREFVGIDLEQKYCEYAEIRVGEFEAGG